MKYLITILISIITLQVWGQANAGLDKVLCNSSAVQIGTTGNGSDCYKWSPETGLDDPNSPTPIASPTTTTTYTLTVVSSDLSSKTTDNVTVTVNIGGITFIPNYLVPDGQSQTLAIASYIPQGQSLSWSIEGNSLGATVLLPVTGMITAGIQEGTITIRATTQPNGCYMEKDIDINGGVGDVTASDISPPLGVSRVAHEGETLYLIDDNSVTITAIPKDGIGFPPNYPQWSGIQFFNLLPITNLPIDGTVSFIDNNIFDGTYIANTKSVAVDRKQKETFNASFGIPKYLNIAEKIEDKLTFNAGVVKISANFSNNCTYVEETVERYGNPNYGTKYELNLNLNGELTGRIIHPNFSGRFPPWPALYSSHWIRWELFLEAYGGFNFLGGLKLDPSSPIDSWTTYTNLNASANAGFRVGYGVYMNSDNPVDFIHLEGQLDASTGITASVGLTNCQLKAEVKWDGIIGNIGLKIYGTNPNDPWVNYSETINLVDGNTIGERVLWDLCNL